MNKTKTVLSGDPVSRPLRMIRAHSFGAAARADVWQLLADITGSGVALDEAIEALINGYLRTGKKGRALVLAEMLGGLQTGDPSTRLAPYTSPSERLILEGLGNQDAGRVFTSAARLLRNRLAMRKALTEAIAMPILLTISLFALILFFGIELLPALGEIIDFSSLPPLQAITVSVTLALSDSPARLFLWIAIGIAALFALMRFWTGAGRTIADRLPPFSVMRMQAGTGFLFSVIEYGRNGTAITAQLLERMAKATGRYEASRIRALSEPLEQTDNLGTAALNAGQGFPDDTLAVVLEVLWDREGGVDRSGKFLERRLEQIESAVKARMAVLNAVLITLVAIVLVLLMSIMMPVFDQINQGSPV